MAKVELNNKQLRLIQKALDFYSRVGILQFDEILSHPTIDENLTNRFTIKKELAVGDQTVRGEVVEIGKGFVKTKGFWGKGEEIREWKDVDKIKLVPDYERLQPTRDSISALLCEVKRLVSGDPMYGAKGASYGIHNPQVDESCREAFDMIQVIRHEFWKADPERSSITVDSSVHIWTQQPAIKVEIDESQK